VTTSISGTVCHLWLGLAMFNPHTNAKLTRPKFEVRMNTWYEDMKGNAKCRNCGGLGWL